jgi:hypothetical protein
MAEAAIRKLPIQMAVLLVTVLEQGHPELLDALKAAGDPPDDVRVAVTQLLVDAAGRDAELGALLECFLELWPRPPS